MVWKTKAALLQREDKLPARHAELRNWWQHAEKEIGITSHHFGDTRINFLTEKTITFSVENAQQSATVWWIAAFSVSSRSGVNTSRSLNTSPSPCPACTWLECLLLIFSSIWIPSVSESPNSMVWGFTHSLHKHCRCWLSLCGITLQDPVR